MAGRFPRDCERARAAVSASVDGELSEIGRARLDAHTAACAGCREYERSTVEATRLLRGAGFEDPGFEIVLPRQRHRLARVVQTGTAAAAAAAVAVVALSGALGTGHHSTPVPASVISNGQSPSVQIDPLHFPRAFAVHPLRDLAARLTR